MLGISQLSISWLISSKHIFSLKKVFRLDFLFIKLYKQVWWFWEGGEDIFKEKLRMKVNKTHITNFTSLLSFVYHRIIFNKSKLLYVQWI